MEIIRLKNISDKDAEFFFEGQVYKVKKGEAKDFLKHIGEHGIRKTMITQDFETGDFISQLIVDDGSEHEEVSTERLSTDARANVAEKIQGAGSVIKNPTGKLTPQGGMQRVSAQKPSAPPPEATSTGESNANNK